MRLAYLAMKKILLGGDNRGDGLDQRGGPGVDGLDGPGVVDGPGVGGNAVGGDESGIGVSLGLGLGLALPDVAADQGGGSDDGRANEGGANQGGAEQGGANQRGSSGEDGPVKNVIFDMLLLPQL